MGLLKTSISMMLLAGLVCSSAMTPRLHAEPAPRRLNVFTVKRDGVIHFYVQNLGLASITATLDMDMTNLQGNTTFPYTTTLGGNVTVEAFALSRIETNAPWNYRYENSCVIGSATAVPDENYSYQLPYAPGSSFPVSQGYHGSFSHCGPDEFAIDWKMPVGTPVHAARGGVVVQSKDDMNRGGPDRKFEKDANCVLIQHSDGTIGIYGHLKHGGNKVKVGDHVNAGDIIALSGNTGFSNGAHLHFAVFKAKNGKERLSLPVKFRDASQQMVTLEMGHTYTAAPLDIFPGETPALAVAGHPAAPITAAKMLQ